MYLWDHTASSIDGEDVATRKSARCRKIAITLITPKLSRLKSCPSRSQPAS